MIKLNRKTGKRFAAMLLAAAFMIASASASYADGPSGPASVTTIAESAKDEAKGPGAQQPAGTEEQSGQAEQQTGQGEQQAAGQEEQTGQAEQQAAGQEQQGQAEQAAGQEQQQDQAEQPTEQQQPAEGLIASGGRYIDPTKPMIALTFDDGPYAPVGNRIMDSLEQYNGRATFFVVGNRVPSYQAEIKRMHDNGHEIGNHTYEHKYLNKLNAAQIRSQIDRGNQIVAAVTGEAPALVRLPGGNKNNTVLANINQPIIMWNIDTLDWKTRNAASTVQKVLGSVKDGDIVLMHELYTASGDAAVTLIPALSEQGYQLVTVSELARFRGGLSNKGVYYSFPK